MIFSVLSKPSPLNSVVHYVPKQPGRRFAGADRFCTHSTHALSNAEVEAEQPVGVGECDSCDCAYLSTTAKENLTVKDGDGGVCRTLKESRISTPI